MRIDPGEQNIDWIERLRHRTPTLVATEDNEQ